MKSEKFVADETYGEWAGTYKVKAMSAAEHIQIEDKVVKYVKKKGGDPTKVESYPIDYYRGSCLIKTVIKDGKELSIKEPLKLFNEMPNRLYMILMRMYQTLNEPNPEESNFLLGL